MESALGDEQDVEDFVAIMDELDLAYPKRIDRPSAHGLRVTEPEPAEPSDREADAWAPVLRTPRRSGPRASGWQSTVRWSTSGSTWSFAASSATSKAPSWCLSRDKPPRAGIGRDDQHRLHYGPPRSPAAILN